ncbi:unnamed protein product [Rotaria sordida]|uniref:Uncharacterized protein n=1 Tax=Rotaria sordida TaxID=392033 RepID=A0A814VWU4_9BILA|nr:unnamed protein product [Rotaria sordida]CAF1259217.1 unnamed protein product [Rotaria sordida]CAF1457707.1 unnamed protein product [Rotaria sordida]CAF4013019.1 unnamed protein product [Rotaria sordida]
MIRDYREEKHLSKETINNEKDLLYPEDIYFLIENLYRLPINGKTIREQINILQISQTNILSEREVFVELTAKAEPSKLMLEFKSFISSEK